MRIVFMGTPEFAVPSLALLIEHGYQVVGVITAADKKGGRGKSQLIESAVKKYALSKGLTLLQPTNLKDPDFIKRLKTLEADVQLVVAFRMLPEVVWNMPPLGTYNLHGSLLPKYRGAAPINWAIIRGEEMTGLTTFKLKHAIDTGNLAHQTKVPISKTDSAGSLHDKMMVEGAKLLLKTVKSIGKGMVPSIHQKENEVSTAPKIYHKDCEINWSDGALDLYNYIRGLNPYPIAWTSFKGKKLKIYSCLYSFENHNKPLGSFWSDGNRKLQIMCRNGWIEPKEIQLEGKKRMKVNDFLNGLSLTKSNSLIQLPHE